MREKDASGPPPLPRLQMQSTMVPMEQECEKKTQDFARPGGLDFFLRRGFLARPIINYSSVRMKMQLFEKFLRPVKNAIVFYFELY